MANTILTSSVIAQEALATLYETTVMAPLVHRSYEAEFARKIGDAITIRKPATFTAQEYNRTTRTITIQDATETSVNMTLNHMADVSFSVTSEDMALKIDDFRGRLLAPAMEAIAQKIDDDLLLLRADITQEVGGAAYAQEDVNVPAGTYNWADSRVLIEAGKVLTRNKVPMGDRRVVAGPETGARWVAERTWRQADKRGDTMGLREANLGPRVSGFDPYQTQNVAVTNPQGAGISTTEESVAFHESAFALAFRPLELPPGAIDAAIETYKGMALRVVYGYDMAKKSTVVSVDCLYGTKTIDPLRAVLIKGADGA